jgi:hypothetical protein
MPTARHQTAELLRYPMRVVGMKNLRVERLGKRDDRLFCYDVAPKSYALTRVKVFQIIHTSEPSSILCVTARKVNAQMRLAASGPNLIDCLHGPLLPDTNILSLKY